MNGTIKMKKRNSKCKEVRDFTHMYDQMITLGIVRQALKSNDKGDTQILRLVISVIIGVTFCSIAFWLNVVNETMLSAIIAVLVYHFLKDLDERCN